MTPCPRRRSTSSVGSVSGTKRDETRLIRLRDDLEALGQRRAALGGHLRRALEAPLGGDLERRREAGERRPADPAGVEALGAGSRHERAVRLLLGLGEVARQGDAKRLGVGYDQRARHVRATEPFLARDRVEVEEPRHSTGITPAD